MREVAGRRAGQDDELFAQLAGDDTPRARMAKVLVGPTFAKGRYAWSAAWATRMGWPGESYGNQLLRIELRPEAYIVAFVGKNFSAFDLSNKPAKLEDVLAAPVVELARRQGVVVRSSLRVQRE